MRVARPSFVRFTHLLRLGPTSFSPVKYSIFCMIIVRGICLYQYWSYMEEKGTTCPITDTVVTATTSLRPTVPDRQAFQQALREYNQSISETAGKIDRIIGTNSTVGTLNILKQSRQEPRKRREQLKLEADGMKTEITEIKKLLAEKDALLSNIENDLVYKDESKLTTRLNELETAYSQTKFTSSRTEKALVKEIDKLKRNRAKLTQVYLTVLLLMKYKSVMEEKRVIQLQLCGINERRSNVLKSIREITNQLDNTDRHIRQQRREFLQLKDSLCDLHAKKKKLVDNYNKKRAEYIDWSNKNKKDLKCSSVMCSNYPYPATYPATFRRQSCWCFFPLTDSVEIVRDFAFLTESVHTFPNLAADFIDEETLEPFYEQKMACKRLIEYLTSLQSQMPLECSSSSCNATDKTCKQITVDGSEDSADEYPPSFTTLKMQASLPVCITSEQELVKEASFVNVLKKKNCKKSSKKPCQKISHPMQMLFFFKETEIPIPQTYREIDHTLSMVRTLLKQYQEQTNVIVWEESDYRQFPSLSESEHTVDSAWNGSTDTSDRSSINFYTCSSFDLTSPVQEKPQSSAIGVYSQKPDFPTLLSVSDGGFASKSSTH
ncbi:unnamed protein product [Litomosoides sigmodontis]|uniref:Uncharacterized protein n=1 Tax=Litomosoides sigmodontis TaxID=42156 RepID=A0A3P6SWG5_LITSI|nr:unnamed protein product [Litomosoides sigmodontis]